MPIFEPMQIIKRMRSIVLLCIVQLFIVATVKAQQSPKCAFDKTVKAIIEKNPSFADVYREVKAGARYSGRAMAKGTANLDAPVIPIVFHVILTDVQQKRIKDSAGIIQRIHSQVDALNRDFNAQNADSASIPGGFKSLFGNTGVSFALAHTAPDGSPTPGYEIITTDIPGFNLEGGAGSGFGFSSAKHAEGGGVDAWDTDSYLNIWLINTLEDGVPTNILGLAIPTYIAADNNGIGYEERGIVMHFAAFGVRDSQFDYYIKGSDQGRTLTHEAGHYLDLLHIWGDDEGKCPENGGADDGIADTPPQAYSSSGCYAYPKYDACTKTGDGIMYMNYMDYSIDACATMFTHQQADKMRAAIMPGGDVYALTQHPWLLLYPDAANPIVDNDYVIYPNPADDRVNITFRKQPGGLKGIFITDLTGRVVATEAYDRQAGFYTFSVAGLFSGMYLVVLDFETGRQVRKIFVR